MPRITHVGAAALLWLAAGCSSELPTPPTPRASVAAADRPTEQASGALRLCKAAGAGLAAGQSFAFRISLAGVVRTTNVTVGSCAVFEVPRERTPLSKGAYRAGPDLVARLVPSGSSLEVDGAALSSASLGTILGGASGTTPSALLLNLAQQLIAADLNVLLGVQAPASVLQAMAEANAALQVSTAGGGVQLASALTTAQQSAIVDVLSSFNEGKGKLPAPQGAAELRIAEVAGGQVDVAGIACDPTPQCANADLASGTVTATVGSGATTVVTYTNTARTVLRVCKVAGAGVTAGTSYHFSIVLLGLGTYQTTMDVPADGCRDAVVSSGSYLVQETVPANFAVSAIACAPSGACGTPILADGVVTATVASNTTTTVTYTNRSTVGTLRVCKVAGAGIAQGTAFHFSAARLGLESFSASVDVPAGECRDAAVREGPYALQETITTAWAVTDIACAPTSACQSTKLADGFIIPTVTAQQTTVVTYTNRSRLATLRVCTPAGSGLPSGTTFHVGAARLGLESFSAGFDVPTGECREASVLEGSYLFQESVAAGFPVLAITCDPVTACPNPPILADGVIIGTVAAQGTLTVTYTHGATAALRADRAAGSP